jgi:WD40 repeat protein
MTDQTKEVLIKLFHHLKFIKMKCLPKLTAVFLFFCLFQLVHFAAKAQDTSASKNKDKIADFELSPDQKYISFTADSKTVKVFEVATGKLQYLLEESSSPVYSIDGKYLATVSMPGEVKVWETSSGKMIDDLKIETKGHISFIRFSPSGKYIYAIALPSSFVQSMSQELGKTANSYTTVWETATGKLLHTYNKALYQFSADESQIIYISKPFATLNNYWVDVCKADSVNIHFSFESEGDFPACSKDGKYILNPRKKKTEIWEMASGKMVYKIDDTYCWFTKDGKYIVCGDDSRTTVSSIKILETATFKFQDVSTCDILSGYEPNKDYIVRSFISKDDIEIWRADSCALLQTIKGETLLTYSPDGKSILGLSGRFAGDKVSLRNLATAELVYSLTPAKGKMTDANFSPAGTFIITINNENTLPVHQDMSIWGTASGKLLYSYRGNFGQFTKDEKYLVIGSNSDVKICEPYSGKVLYTLY